MMHEVYHSGYGDNNELWLRDWGPIPGMTYNLVVFANLTPKEIDVCKKILRYMKTKEKIDKSLYFMVLIYQVKLVLLDVWKVVNKLKKQNISHTGYVSWVDIKNDKHTH